MDDKMRSETDTNDTESTQKSLRKRRTPSGEPSDRNEGRPRRRSVSRSKSRSPSRERGRRRRSRSRSPDRRYGRFSRGGYQRDFHNRRKRSPSPDRYKGRNRNVRRSPEAEGPERTYRSLDELTRLISSHQNHSTKRQPTQHSKRPRPDDSEVSPNNMQRAKK